MPKKKQPVQLKVKSTSTKLPDEAWFRGLMRQRGLERPDVAKAMGLAARGDSVWQMLTGKRSVKLEEVAIWAKLLDVPYLEVVRRLGFDVPDSTVPVVGTLRVNGRITPRPADQAYRVPAPPGVGAKCVAIVVEGAHTALAVFEGTHLFYEHTEGVAVDAFDRLSVVELAEHGSAPIVGLLTRGAMRHVRIVVFGGLETLESTQLVGAWPVLWQRAG